MINIPELTIICIDCYNYGKATAALQKCNQQVKAARTVFLTDIEIELDGIEVMQIPTISSKEEYSRFCIKELYKYFDTTHCLIVQWDGYILDGNLWNPEFTNCDYIGAPWIYEHNRNVGNGGFSIRSWYLQEILGTDETIDICSPEDQSICIIYGNYLKGKYGIKFATEELADTFSYELKTPCAPTFGFHGNFHQPYQQTVVITRKAALGDVVCVEPVLYYFWEKGYRVVLDTLPQFQLLFLNHYFKVHRTDEVDQRLLKTAKYINLDGSYEAEPTLNHLQAYFKYSGITDTERYLRKPKLSVGFPLNKETKIFSKYAVIHYDKRGQNGRNIFGINWDEIASFLISSGYIVVQIGKGEHYPIKGAIEMNITNENFLCFLIGGADIFIGGDSGPSNIAVSFNVPSAIFFGAVDANIIHYDLSRVLVLDNGKCCDTAKCWHSIVGGTEGVKCIVDESLPPCVNFDTYDTIDKISLFINKINDTNIQL